jgi:hypothetical protein
MFFRKKKIFFRIIVLLLATMDPVYVVCKIPIQVQDAETVKIIKEFPEKQVATMSVILRHELTGIPMEVFGNTFKEFSHNLSLVQALDLHENSQIVVNWKDTVEFLRNISFSCEHQRNEEVLFRITNDMNLERGTALEPNKFSVDFEIYASRLIYDYFLPMLPNVTGIFHVGSGWMKFDQDWLTTEFKDYLDNPHKFENFDFVTHQGNTFRNLLRKLNEQACTHWKCTRFSMGPNISKSKKRKIL